MSEELGGFIEYVGGPTHAHVLLSPLENLAAIEEPLVREKAVESLNKICAELSQHQIEDFLIPLVVRLSKADWFTSKVSATGLYTAPLRAGVAGVAGGPAGAVPAPGARRDAHGAAAGGQQPGPVRQGDAGGGGDERHDPPVPAPGRATTRTACGC